MKSIIKTTQELSNTIETFRDFTHNDKLTEFDLSELINTSIETQASIIEQNHINVVTDFEENVKVLNFPNSLLQKKSVNKAIKLVKMGKVKNASKAIKPAIDFLVKNRNDHSLFERDQTSI